MIYKLVMKKTMPFEALQNEILKFKKMRNKREY